MSEILVQGRANDGGLRIGEMERDGVLAHGMSYFLNESFMVRGDEYYIAVCNKTGAIAIYNESKNIFLSPNADGPINFITNPDGTQNIKNMSKFGRSFSILRVPYSLKLLIQELQVMNIQMRIITDDNVDQLLSMSYSDNINKLLQVGNEDLKNVTQKLNKDLQEIIKPNKRQFDIPDESISIPDPVNLNDNEDVTNLLPDTQYKKGQEVEVRNDETREKFLAVIRDVYLDDQNNELYDVEYGDGETEQQVDVSRIKPYNMGYIEQPYYSDPENSGLFTPVSPPQYSPNSPPQFQYSPNSPQYIPNSPPYNPTSPPQTQMQQPIQIQILPQALVPNPSILEVETEKEEGKDEGKDENTSKSETKKVNFSDDTSDTSDTSSDSKKITL